MMLCSATDFQKIRANLYIVLLLSFGGTRTNLSRPAPLFFYGCVGLVGLGGDLDLQLPYQLRCVLTGKVFKAGNLKAAKHLSNVRFLIVCSLG